MIDSLEEIKEIPIVGGLLAFSVDIIVNGGDFLLAGLSSILLSVGDLVPILSLVAGTIAPRLEWLPQGLFDRLLLLAAVVFVGVQIGRLIQ